MLEKIRIKEAKEEEGQRAKQGDKKHMLANTFTKDGNRIIK